MRNQPTVYGLIGTVARVGGLVAAVLVIVVGTFQGVSGMALFGRVATAFLAATIVLNVLGFVMVRSFLAGIVAEQQGGKEPAGSNRSQ